MAGLLVMDWHVSSGNVDQKSRESTSQRIALALFFAVSKFLHADASAAGVQDDGLAAAIDSAF